jgi:hypothetical protein
MQCGAQQFHVPGMEAPADAPRPPGHVQVLRNPPGQAPGGPGSPVSAPPGPAPMVGVTDYGPHITVGYLLALVATLVLPPLFGAIALGLGWLAYSRGAGHQRKQGLYVMLAAIAATALGLAIAFYVDHIGLLR